MISLPANNRFLVTKTVGIDPVGNKLLFEYLLSVKNRGEVTQSVFETVISSFDGIEVGVISSSRLARVIEAPFNMERTLNTIFETENGIGVKSLGALECKMILNGLDNEEKVSAKKFHLMAARFFLK